MRSSSDSRSTLLTVISFLCCSSALCFVTSPCQLGVRKANSLLSVLKPVQRPSLPTTNSLRPWCMMGQSTGQQQESASVTVGAHKQIQGILFDIDGTLFDSDPVHFEVFVELLGKEGIQCDHQFFREKIAGRQNQQIMQDLFPEWSVEKSTAWSAAKEARFRELAPGTLKPMSGLIELMEWIDKKGLKKAAVTNAPRDNAEMMLNSIGRLDWFDCVIIGDECERAKPDPMPYQLAMEKLGLEPSTSMVIEDSPSGARAGVAAGALTVGILTSQPAEALTAQGCKLLINDYHDEQLWAVLDKERSS